MLVEVKVVPADDDSRRPPPGTPVLIELRDTSLADAPSRVLAAAEGVLETVGDRLLASAVLDVDGSVFTPQAELTLWARCRVSGAARVSSGDWITMESVPVRRDAIVEGAPIEIAVRPVP